MKKIKLPLFIVFEGIDGSGKTSISEMMKEYCRNKGIPVLKIQEPTEGTWGKKIRQLLKTEDADPDELLQLFLKDREDDVVNNIQPSLDAKKLIILDRYYFSNAAYQGAMGIPPEHIIKENQKRKFPEPDRIYCMDINPELALQRISGRNGNGQVEIFEKADFLKKVSDIYRLIADSRFKFLDASKSINEILNIIIEDLSNNFYSI